MRIHARPVIINSACLGTEPCRYNGEAIHDMFTMLLGKHAELITVCPEAGCGLGIPRAALRLVEEDERIMAYQPSSGLDVTKQLHDFCHNWLNSLSIEPDGCLFKSRSPSCGPVDVRIYSNRTQNARISKGAGLFADMTRAHFPGITIEDEGRLRNFRIRDHFLTTVFTKAALREIINRHSISELQQFQTRNKLLFLYCNEKIYREMGRLLASFNKHNLSEIGSSYTTLLTSLFAKLPREQAIINALQHAFGPMSESLGAEERKLFLDTLEEFRDERVPLSVPLRLLQAWAVRLSNNWLLEQSLLEPYPKELMLISDSGKGREL